MDEASEGAGKGNEFPSTQRAQQAERGTAAAGNADWGGCGPDEPGLGMHGNQK